MIGRMTMHRDRFRVFTAVSQADGGRRKSVWLAVDGVTRVENRSNAKARRGLSAVFNTFRRRYDGN
jgi:hypothetical protein